VRLSGEYLSWSPYPQSYATADPAGLPPGCFVLRNEGGAIYCDPTGAAPPARASLGALGADMPALTPYAPIGRRIAVSGAPRLLPDGRPLLALNRLEALSGLPGVTCLVRFERESYLPGERLRGTLTVANPSSGTVTAPLLVGGPVFTIASPEGDISLSVLEAPGLAQEGSLRLNSGERVEIPFAWAIPDTATPGVYSVTAQLTEGLAAYPACFRVSTTGQTDK